MENQKKAQLNNDGFNEDSIANILSFGPSNNSPDNGRQEKRKVTFDLDVMNKVNKMIVEVVQVSEQDSEVTIVQQEIKRVKQNWVYFIFTWIFSVITATENLYIFLGTMDNRDVYFTLPTLIVRMFFYPIATYNLCQNWKVLARLVFMIDKILLANVLLYIGVMGFILIFLQFSTVAWFYQSLFVLFPTHMLLYAGNFRVMMVYCQWTKVQVILFKITLLIGSTSYFILGMYYLVQGLRFTRGLSDQVDQIISNLLLIYINAGFQFFLQLFSRMDSVDGTSGFKNDYKLHCNPQDMEALLKGRPEEDENQSKSSKVQSEQNFQNSQIQERISEENEESHQSEK